jgi:hypothetical protein
VDAVYGQLISRGALMRRPHASSPSFGSHPSRKATSSPPTHLSKYLRTLAGRCLSGRAGWHLLCWSLGASTSGDIVERLDSARAGGFGKSEALEVTPC